MKRTVLRISAAYGMLRSRDIYLFACLRFSCNKFLRFPLWLERALELLALARENSWSAMIAANYTG